MKIVILTLFPEMIQPVLQTSILGRAIEAGHLEIEVVNIRDYTQDKHRNTDDYPFGGGAGMVMQAQPIVDAVAAHAEKGMRRIYMSPRGRTLTQRVVEEYARCDSLLFLCGHYEGVDERALEMCIDEELSIGDYVLTGGELGALVAVDAVSRLIPGVLGSEESSEDESFTTGLLEYPQYTRPAEFRGHAVPEVLLNGNHDHIERWRRMESLRITRERRPDLLASAPLTEEDRTELAAQKNAERVIAGMREKNLSAHRLEMLEEADYGKEWIRALIAPEKKASAKRHLIGTRKQAGYLYQAFEKGMLPDIHEVSAQGAAVLYFNREKAAVWVEDAQAAMEYLEEYTVLTAADYSWTIAVKPGGRVIYRYGTVTESEGE